MSKVIIEQGRNSADFSICATLETPLKSAVDNYGVIFLLLNGESFPDVDWGDFVVVLLGWWTMALKRLCDNAATEEWCFMEGPFFAYLTRKNDCLIIQAKTESSEDVFAEVIVQTKRVVLELLRVVREILQVTTNEKEKHALMASELILENCLSTC